MAKKQFKFEVVEDFDLGKFCTTIETMLNSGWELHGQMIAFPNYIDDGKVESVRYTQALVKDDTPKRRGGFMVAEE